MSTKLYPYRVVLTLLLACLLFGSCGRKTCTLSSTSIVRSFDRQKTLNVGEAASVEVKGALDIKCQNGTVYCLTLNPAGMIVGFEEKDPSNQHSFMKIGNGPYEMTGPVPFHTMAFHEDGGQLMSDMYNMRNKVIRINLTSSLKESRTVGIMEVELPPDLAGRGALTCLDMNTYCFQYPSPEMNRVIRGIWQNGSESVVKAQERLNHYTLDHPDGIMFNMLMTSIGYNPEIQRFVEASSMLNTIHLYDRKGSFAKTICLWGPADDIGGIEAGGAEGLSNTCIKLQTYPDYFAVLYSGDSIYHPTGKLPSILFFDWSGRPLLEILCPVPVSSFDFMDGKLYLLTPASEHITIFDLPSSELSY